MAEFFENCELFEQCFAKQVWFCADMMLAMDWVTRHEVWVNLVEEKPHDFLVALASILGPDQLYDGWATGVPPPTVIVLNVAADVKYMKVW
jgi:hypothetical protein